MTTARTCVGGQCCAHHHDNEREEVNEKGGACTGYYGRGSMSGGDCAAIAHPPRRGGRSLLFAFLIGAYCLLPAAKSGRCGLNETALQFPTRLFSLPVTTLLVYSRSICKDVNKYVRVRLLTPPFHLVTLVSALSLNQSTRHWDTQAASCEISPCVVCAARNASTAAETSGV
jgi:hypothetical protein